MLDCLIIGGGPAGLTAATYLARYRRNTRVIDAGQSRTRLISESHNYPGFHGIAGPELLQRLRSQAESFGVAVASGEATQLRRTADGFAVALAGGEIAARAVLLATGLVDKCPPVEGPSDPLKYDAIRYCPVCDGYEATDARVGIVGSLGGGGRKALFMRSFTRDLSLFVTEEGDADDALRAQLAEAGVRLLPAAETITRLVPDGVEVRAGGETHRLTVLYPTLGCTVHSELATRLGAECSENGNLIVDAHQQTSVAGLYAAGDVVSDLHQLSVAIGHAAIAATAIHNRLPPNPR